MNFGLGASRPFKKKLKNFSKNLTAYFLTFFKKNFSKN
jgi:hypothetical protein